MLKNVLIPTILCGGAGSRLWPLSREEHPKPFIRLNDNQSLLQKAFLRAAQLEQVDHILTVSNQSLYFKIEDEYQSIASELTKPVEKSYILEPMARNTAPAIAAAAQMLAKVYSKDCLMLILTADHLISNQAAFNDAVKHAAGLAEQGHIVTFGISPTSPETGYGYIEASGEDLIRFVEKPDQKTAENYLASGRFLWNSGMLCASAEAFLKAFHQYCPDILSDVTHCLSDSQILQENHRFQLSLDAKSFAKVRDESIDYAIMEKVDDAKVITCHIGWSDIGCWRSLGDLTTSDKEQNKITGHVILKDSHNCTIQASERTVAAVGLENLIIVDTDDAVLVADKSATQQVKEVYMELKAQNHHTHKYHRTVHRPWGSYTVLEEGEDFKIKRIVVKPGASLSLQMHQHRSEHWVVVSGEAEVINNDKTQLLQRNESTFIPAGHKHRLANRTTQPLIIIEVQTGHYLGEDDITRFDDIYGRELEIV